GITSTLNTFSDKLRAGFIPDSRGVYPSTPVAIDPRVAPYLPLFPRPNGAEHLDGTADYSFDFSQPTTEDTFMVRMDHTLSDKDTLFGRYTFLNSTQDLLNGGFENYLLPIAIKNQYAALGENRIFSA